MATDILRTQIPAGNRGPPYHLVIGQRISHFLLGNRSDHPLLLVKTDPPLLANGRQWKWIDVYDMANVPRGPIDLSCQNLDVRLAVSLADHKREVVVGVIQGRAYIERIDFPVYAKSGVLSARGLLALSSTRD